jgi:HD-GYP domain-containing protein (c-di-GMP phosphodiesterase class II)
MSLQQLKVFINELEVGMFVSALDKPWAETPFPIQGFMIKSIADASRVKAYCDYVYIDVAKGASPIDLKAADSATAAGINAPHRRSGSSVTVAQKSISSVANNFRKNNHSANRHSAGPRSFVVKPYIYNKTVELAKEIPAARRVMSNLVGCLSVATRQIARGGSFNLDQLQETVDNMVDSVVRCPDAFTWLLRLRAKDPHTHDHSIRSSLWATQFARHIGLEIDQLKDLCLATLLKDVGKAGMDRKLLRSVNRNAEEEAEYRSFVSTSVENLKQSDFNNRRALNIIKYHCERYDGSGFPKGCSGKRIPFLAAVAGIASEFDRLCNPREVAQTLTPSKATGRLYELRGQAFAEDLVIEFIRSVGLYPAGTVVELSTGDVGMVVEQNPKSRLSPRVAVFEGKNTIDGEPNCIFVDLKNEEKSRTQLHNFGSRRAFEVSKLAITKDIDPEKLNIDDQLLNRLIGKPFDTPMSGLFAKGVALGGAESKSKGGFLSALKQRLSS